MIYNNLFVAFYDIEKLQNECFGIKNATFLWLCSKAASRGRTVPAPGVHF